MDERIFRVSEFNEFINLYLGGVGEVIVEGEVSEIRVSQGKWIFLTIKDEESSVEVFGITYQISGYSLLEPGMLVHVYGTPRLYKKTGRFSIFADSIAPAGEGALRIAFEKLKQKLENEGLFDPERKRPIPAFPENIGLITAKDSMAYGDFIKVLSERMGGIKIYFYPVIVQGKDSVASIVRAFKYFNESNLDLDLLVLVRGGGSLEDLQAFNDESVARAIFSSKFPVVCGVGHEGDVTISDLVADLRASTPSNAAELIVREREEVLNEILFCTKTMEGSIKRVLDDKNRLVLAHVNTLKNAIGRRLMLFSKNISRFNAQFAIFTKNVINLIQKTDEERNMLYRLVVYWIKQKERDILSLTRILRNLDYRVILEKGFSITLDANGKLIRSVSSVRKNDRITTSLYDGKIGSEVLEISKSYG